MSRQTLYLDLDDVVLDFTKTYKEVATYLWHNRKEFGITKENLEDAVDTYLLNNYHKVKVNKDFRTVVPLLLSKYRVVFVSMYVSEGELAYKKHLAKVYVDEGIFLNVVEYKNKSANKQSGSGLYLSYGSSIPEYSGKQIITINNDKPYFTIKELNSLNTDHYFTYGGNDAYGRTTSAIATITKNDLKASETRKGIELPNPVGWVSRSKGGIYDRSHLIAYTFGGRNDSTNLVTGTISFNQKYMAEVEGDVRDYIKSSGSPVLYRVTPYYRGNELPPLGY